DELGGDLAVLEAARDQADDFALAVGQRIGRRDARRRVGRGRERRLWRQAGKGEFDRWTMLQLVSLGPGGSMRGFAASRPCGGQCILDGGSSGRGDAETAGLLQGGCG